MQDSQKRKNLILGKGFVGSHLAALLIEKGEEVTTLSRGERHDLRQAENYFDKFEWADRVWFVAWDIGVWKKDTTPAYEAGILDSNLRLCQSVFHCLEKSEKPFLFVSSQAALAPDMITLGVTKRVGELWAKILGGHIARFWNVYGWEPVGAKSHLVPDLVWSGLTKGEVAMMSNGEETRQFVYVRDAVEALWHQFNSGQKVADIVGFEWTPVKKIAEIISHQLGAKLILGREAGKPSLFTPSTPLVGWQPRFSLEAGIEETIKQAKS